MPNKPKFATPKPNHPQIDDSGNGVMSRTPIDVITDILHRLPVKTLFRFKSLSKPCCTIIEDPDFVRSHLNRSIETGSNLHILLKGLHLYTVDFEALDITVPLEFPSCNTAGTEAFGSCNGIIALRITDKNLALYNPSTRQFRKLSVSEFDPPSGESGKSGYVFYGFGQDVKSHDYKVVRMAQFNSNEDGDGEGILFDYEVKVYSLKNDSWRKITNFPSHLKYMFQFFYHLMHRRGYGVLAGGVLHWVIPPRFEFGLPNTIIGFNLESEEFVLVPQPKCDDINYLLDVGVLEGRLCAVCNYEQVNADVWVMKEYGVEESWTKLLSVRKTRVLSSLSYVKPLVYSKDRDKILLEINNQKFAWYDLQKKKMRSVKIGNGTGTFGAEFYVGSLVRMEDQKRIENQKQNEQHEEKKEIGKKRDDFLSHGFKLVL